MTRRAPEPGQWRAPGQRHAEYADDAAHASATPSPHLSVPNSEMSDTPTSQTRTQSVSALPDVWRSQLSLSSALSSITQEAVSVSYTHLTLPTTPYV